MRGGGNELLVAVSENCVRVGNCLRGSQVNGVVAALGDPPPPNFSSPEQ